MNIDDVSRGRAVNSQFAMSKKAVPTNKLRADSVELSQRSSSSNQETAGTPGDKPEGARVSAPPVRAEKIEQARRAIEAGGYSQPEVLRTIIDRIILAMKEV